MKNRLGALVVLLLLATGTIWAGVTASISGTVTDPTGAVIPGAAVTAHNTDTGIDSSTQTNAQGFYSFPALPTGKYEVRIKATGFEEYRETGLVLDVNNALRIDAAMKVGAVTQEVSVSSTAVHVETTNTQMGEVIGTHQNDQPAAEWPQLHGPAGSATGRGAHFQWRGLGHECFRKPEPRGAFGQRTAGSRQRLHGERRQCRGKVVQQHRHHPQPRFHRRIPHSHQQCRRRVWELFRRDDQRHYQVRHQPVPRRCLRVHAESPSRFPQLLFSQPRHAYTRTFSAARAADRSSTTSCSFLPTIRGRVWWRAWTPALISVPSAADKTGNLADVAGLLDTTCQTSSTPPQTVPCKTVDGTAWANTLTQHWAIPSPTGSRITRSGCTTQRSMRISQRDDPYVRIFDPRQRPDEVHSESKFRLGLQHLGLRRNAPGRQSQRPDRWQHPAGHGFGLLFHRR